MENGVTDRLWDRDVQGFIEACRYENLTDITLGYTVMDSGRKVLNVSAVYRSRTRGSLAVGYRWAETQLAGWMPEVFVARHTAPSHPAAFRALALKAGLWRERRDLVSALHAVMQVFFRAQMVRGGLDREHLEKNPDSGSAHAMTLQTLNDLAFLYSGQSIP